MISKILCRLSSIFLIFIIIFTHTPRSNAQGNCIKYDIIGGNAPKGDCIWVPIKIYNFDSILGFQVGIAYDPQVLMPVGKWVNRKLPNLDTSSNSFRFDTIKKIVILLWTDINSLCQEKLNDGDTLFMIKFKLIGEPGSCTPVGFTLDRIFTNEFYDCNVDNYCIEEINLNDNQICVGQPTDLCVFANACGTLTNTGTITIKPFGGRPPYIITRINPAGQPDTLKNSGDSKTYNNLFPGVHEIRVIDSLGKDTIIKITIDVVSPIVIMHNGITQPKCWNEATGSINILISGGSGGYTIGWRPLNVYGVTSINRLNVGQYTVTVTDTSGCVAREDFLLFADTLFTQAEVLKDASCADDGVVVARASGGNPCPVNKYNFIWSQNPAANTTDTASINSKLSGNQFVIISDCRGCQDTVFFEVKFSGDLLDSLVIDSIPCFDSTGTIHSFVSSKGTLNIPVSFILCDSLTGKPILGGVNGVADYISPKLKAGTYILKITDNAGCTRNDTFRLTQPDSLEIIDIQLDLTESCNPGQDAFIIVRCFGGTPTCNFRWDSIRTGGSINMLSQGMYTLTVTDFHGCSATKSYTVTQPNGPQIDSFSLVHPNCSGDTTGSIQVHYRAGMSPINQISWSVPGSTSTINNLGIGTYRVTITDQDGCVATDSATLIPSGNSLRISGSILTDPGCNGDPSGSIAISLTNVKGIPVYQWDNNNQSSINTNLKAGTYCVTIDDTGSSCPPIDTCFVLTDPPKIDIQLSNLLAPTCATAGTCDGSAIAFATGADSSYQIIWSSGERSNARMDTANQLCDGDQFVIVQNGNTCRDTLLFNIPTAIPITIDTAFLNIFAPTCYNKNDGEISLRAKGGTGPYQYNWLNPMVNSDTITNLGDGLYKVNIIDANNCVHLDSVRLRQPDSIRVDIILGSTLDVSCAGKNDGRITTAWTGGNRGKGLFQWTPNISPDSVAINLAAGRYVLQVTDEMGCTGSNEYTILAPPPIVIQMTPVDTPKCNNDQIFFSVLQASGGSGPDYKFTINSGAPNDIADLIPLFSGIYSIRIFDKNNCFIDTSITITNPSNSLSLDFGKDTDSIQLGDSILLDGLLNASTVIDSIIWDPSNSVRNPSSTTSFVSPTKNTVYTLTVIDEFGCEVSDRITIIVRNTRRFYAPNIFSPNQDQINDFFTLHLGQGVQAVKSLQIFDRWGNKVYQLENPVIDSETIQTWNGRFGNNGDPMAPAVFVYLIEVVFQDGNTTVYRGNLTLVR